MNSGKLWFFPCNLIPPAPVPYPVLLTVSIVSHGHGVMVERLVATLLTYPEVGQLVVTCNIPESLMLPNDAHILLIATGGRLVSAPTTMRLSANAAKPIFVP